jgi:RNA polymerase sporulation-specific sigma factor
MFFDLFFLILHVSASGSFPKPLSSAEERECFRRMGEGDMTARARLIECNMRLVAHIVKKYYQSADDPDDLISIGSLGLIKAVDSFKPDKSTKLATYAARCIENEILMFFRSKKKSANDISINEEIDCDKDGNPLSFMDIISEDDNIVEQIYGKMQTEKLAKAISMLDERERKIILLRYGISEPALTQKETADRLGISRSYVSRLEKKALDTLRKSLL